ncbi:sulfur carrier protein ThiS [Galbibacter orientalis]|uniref:Thiamine biosynthesis protein ThiS n=1 Tax=Galbibacter orientalis DSM 19592 TaxID=926559 RepID=I3C3P7_9FLAO|nr:sulfur carrier protein ThiS [Galbibacter orientalis]EIJ38240.1 thiamine biosynthesis protein ThiS [Galbibacter orientalis DSM 19592]
MTTVNVNNTLHTFQNSLSAKQLLEHLNISPNGIALALNNNVLPKSKWEEPLENNANILIIKATQGG